MLEKVLIVDKLMKMSKLCESICITNKLDSPPLY